MKALVNLGLLFIVLFLAGWELFLVTIVSCIIVLVGRYFFKKLYWDKPTEWRKGRGNIRRNFKGYMMNGNVSAKNLVRDASKDLENIQI